MLNAVAAYSFDSICFLFEKRICIELKKISSDAEINIPISFSDGLCP